jgi:hypothetical protein
MGRTPVRLVVHDPAPLAKPGSLALGYGRLARRIAGIGIVRGTAVVHSRKAQDIVFGSTKVRAADLLPLPMLSPVLKGGRGRRKHVVRVLGQYKEDRDVGALRRLAAGCPARRYEIWGRGWAEIDGWATVDRFVPEAKLQQLIESSDVVVIPYRRFFQSDIAVRCLELGTPVVGPAESSLSALIDPVTGWLVTEDDWEGSVACALRATHSEVYAVAQSAYADVRERWTAWLPQAARSGGSTM